MDIYTGRISRLIKLMSEIKTNPNQPIQSMIKSAGISRAQFYKDKAALEALGFEFSREKGSFKIRKDPFIPTYSLTLTELFSLVMAVRQLSAAGDYLLTYNGLQGIKKIISESPSKVREFLMAAFNDTVLKEGFGCNAKILEDIQNAVSEHRRIEIIHHYYEDNSLKTWTVDPYQIFFKRRALYLDGYCIEEKDFRTYRINRIKKVAFSHLIFCPDKSYSFTQRHQGSFSVFTGHKLHKVKVRFSKAKAPYIKESLWHHSQKIEDLKNGDIIFEVEVFEPKEVAWWAMQWGADAEILEPEELREWVREEIAKMQESYIGKE